MSIFSVIVTVCRGPGAQGIYSTHGTKKNQCPFMLGLLIPGRFHYT